MLVVRDDAGTLRDLAWVPAADADVTPVAADTDDGRAVMRHSAAHVLAQAVQQLFPDARLGIGPPVVDGFYYDFAVERPFTPEDLQALEKAMRRIVKAGQRFVRRAYPSPEAARAELAGEPFKLELVELKGTAEAEDDGEIMEVGAGDLTAYDNVHAHTGERVWGDLCRGPHVPTTKHIAAFAITRSAAAYWRGDQANAQLQRVYGTAWESSEAQDAYLERIAEAERRDHRRLGTELDLFSFPDEIGSGLAVFHPKGGIVRRSSRTTRGSGTPRPATSSSTRRTPPRASCSRPRGTCSGTARACSRPCTSTPSTARTGRSSDRASTTSSSR